MAPLKKAPADGDRNFAPLIAAISILSALLAVVSVFLRCYVRVFMTHGLGWDDACIIASMVVTIPGVVFVMDCVRNGAGRHEFYLTGPQILGVVKWNTAYQLDNIPSVTLTKLSILIFILRIKKTGLVAWGAWGTIGIVVIINILSEFALSLQCIPLEALWNKKLPQHCYPPGLLQKFGYAQGAFMGLTDIIITSSPVFILWKVQIRIQKKIAVCLLMSIGVVATIANISRTALLSTLNADDYTFQIIGILISAILEQNLGIVAACIPTMQPLFDKFAKTKMNSTNESGSGDRSYSSRSASRGKVDAIIEQARPGGFKKYTALSEEREVGWKGDGDDIPLQDLRPDPPPKPSRAVESDGKRDVIVRYQERHSADEPGGDKKPDLPWRLSHV